MKNIEIFIGNNFFDNGKKEFFRITPYVENSDITLDDSSNNILPQISQVVCGFFDNKNLMSEVDGLYEFVKKNREFDLFPLIVFYKEKIIFNGIIQLYNLNMPNGFRFINSKPLEYTFSNIIHKANELKHKYINKLISYKEINILNYLNYLFESNVRITKYKNYDEFEEEFDLLSWGNEYSVSWGQDANSLVWGVSENISTLNGVSINKNLCYNYNTIGIGDAIHIFSIIDDVSVRDSYVIKSVQNFTENTNSGFIEYINLANMDFIYDDILVNINNNTVSLYVNNIEICNGIYNINTNSATLTGTYSGTIKFSDTFDINEVPNYNITWGEEASLIWGQEAEYFNWGYDGLSLSINTSKLYIETFDPILIRSGTTNTRFKIGYHVIGLDDVKDLTIQNPIVSFKDPLDLIDTLSSDYLFNYSVGNDGIISLYTNTSDILEDDNYILQIGNSETELTYDSTISNTNCTLTNQYDEIIAELSEYNTQINITPIATGDYQVKFTINNLTENKRYILSITTDINEVLVQNSGNDLDLEVLDYYENPKFAFIVPNGQTSIDVILNGLSGATATISEFSIKEFYYNDFEMESIFSPLQIESDSTGLRTALHVLNYTQTEKAETLQQISSINPAINTFHKLEDEYSKSSETISTGKNDTQYVQLGRGVTDLTFPISIDKNTFLNNISLSTFRNTLSSEDCMFVSFIRDSSEYVFHEVILYSTLSQSNTLSINPIFLYKDIEDKLECNIRIKKYDSSKTFTNNVFTTTNPNWYTVGQEVNILSSGQLLTRNITNKNGNDITVDGATLNGSYVVLANRTNTITDTYLEFETITIFTSSNDYLIISGTLNNSLTLVKDIVIQNSYVTRYPVLNIGTNYNGSPNVMQLRDEGLLTDTFKIVDLNNNATIGKSFLTNHSDFFDKILDYDLVYLDIFNYSSNSWQTIRLKSYNIVNGTITLWDEIDLSQYSYNDLVQFRRIFITKTTGFESKPTDDTSYEAYITTDRESFGFNYKVDSQAIDYLINKDTSKKFGKIYDIGNIISAVYDVDLTYPRYIEDFETINKYGIIEELYNEEIKDSESYITITENNIRYNAEPVNKTTITVHLEYLDNFDNSKDITKVQLVRLYDSRLKNGGGLYSIENKKYIFKKSGIHTVELSLERIVGY